jgi:hypothetical protein
MAQHDIANMRMLKNLARQDYERQVMGRATGDYGHAGPPDWDRNAWEAFRSQYGFYPYGVQNGSMVYPPTFAGAPEWVYELMGIRKPPIEVAIGHDFTR